MRHNRQQQPRSLAKALDAKVLPLVRQFVHDQASSDAHQPTLQLRVSAIYAYVSGDPALSRHKKQTLNGSIERALDVLRDEAEDSEDGEDDGEDGDELDSEFEGLDVANLMVPDEKQANTLNKRITDMWAVNNNNNSNNNNTASISDAAASVPHTPGVIQPVVDPAGRADAVASPKRKRKEKSEEGRAKRAKGMLCCQWFCGGAIDTDPQPPPLSTRRIATPRKICSLKIWEASTTLSTSCLSL